MWGRRQTAEAPKPTTTTAPGAFGALDQLLKRATWEDLTDPGRSTLRADFAPFPPEAAGTADGRLANIDAAEVERATQQWVASLVALAFQPEAAEVIRSWLNDAPPDTHLFVGGQAGLGRRSLLVSLAREAMAKRQAPSEFCYVPEPSALDRAYLLKLPNGTGTGFTKAFDGAMRRITSGWDEAGASDGDGSGAPVQPGARAQALRALVAEAFEPAEAPTYAAVSAYVAKLRAVFDGLAQAEADLPVSYDDLPTWLVPVSPAQVRGDGAPVVVGALTRDKLDDLLLRANGGVLILSADEVVAIGDSWLTLNGVLSSKTYQVKNGWPLLPLNVRVALVGHGGDYNALAGAPGEFTRLFRYETWLNPAVAWSSRSEAAYAALADGVAAHHGLPAFDPSGASRLIEEGARRGDGLNRSYLVADLVLARDLAVEAGRAAAGRGASATTGADVAAVVQRRRTLQGMNARRVREAILSGQANTPTAGSAVGQVNGLGIYEFHPSEGDFAVPTRISATVSPGRDERLLDIEHEAEQADADHVRGEMTIEGYLAHRYGQERLLRVIARIRFEQEHGTTGGDSASGAILYALLSALAQVPIRYSYAVTGAVGQYGELQPIGGVNTKIEGFWELCRLRRTAGEQVAGGYGVIIPAVNTRDLMLRDEVAQSIATEGWFRVYPVSTVDEALSLLTGVPASELHMRVEQRLQRFHALGQAGVTR